MLERSTEDCQKEGVRVEKVDAADHSWYSSNSLILCRRRSNTPMRREFSGDQAIAACSGEQTRKLVTVSYLFREGYVEFTCATHDEEEADDAVLEAACL